MRIDKEALMSVANAIDVARYIGIDVQKKGTNYFMLCPGHQSRLGKPDTKLGNCVVYPDGYVCYACDAHAKHNVFDMVMEHTNCTFVQALETVAEIYGGRDEFKTSAPQEKLPLSQEDLALIGLKPHGKIFLPQNASFEHFEPEEGFYIEKENDDANHFLKIKAPSTYSLLTLKRENEEAFRYLIASKAKEAGIKYQTALKDFSKRTSKRASEVFDVFEEDGYIDESVFFGLENALKRKAWRCKEIYDTYKNST